MLVGVFLALFRFQHLHFSRVKDGVPIWETTCRGPRVFDGMLEKDNIWKKHLLVMSGECRVVVRYATIPSQPVMELCEHYEKLSPDGQWAPGRGTLMMWRSAIEGLIDPSMGGRGNNYRKYGPPDVPRVMVVDRYTGKVRPIEGVEESRRTKDAAAASGVSRRPRSQKTRMAGIDPDSASTRVIRKTSQPGGGSTAATSPTTPH